MAEIVGLLDVFRAAEKDSKEPPEALARSLRSDAARPGLNRLLAVLRAGVFGDGDGAGRRGFEGWTPAQIEAVASVVGLVVPALLPVSAELADLALVGIVAESLELCISFLEKPGFDGENFSLQENFARLLELALADRVIEEQNASYHDLLRSCSEQISTLTVKAEILDLSNYLVCNQQGFNCMKNSQVVERLLTTLSSECGQMEPFHAQFSSSTDSQTSDSLASVAQHLAVVHLKCHPRLLTVCKRLLHGPLSFDKLIDDENLSHRLSFTQRILKLLLNLARKVPLDVCDVDLLYSVASFVDTFPTLFKLKFDFSNHSSSYKEEKYDSVLLEMHEDFLELIQVSFYGSNVFYNVQARLLASLMEILDGKVWRYDSSTSLLSPPIIYSPQIILYMLKILKDAKSWASQTYGMEVKPLPDRSDESFQYKTGSPSWHIHSENISLLKKYSYEEYLTLLFPPTTQWVGNLVHLAYFLHSEGVKMSVIVETSRASCVKPTTVPDLECVANHDEEAIFGNLFSEGSRSIGSADGLDLPTSAVISASSSSDLPIQVATDVLIFLKTCIFSPDWSHLLFEDACRQVDENIINQLLTILNCQTCLSFHNNSLSGAVLNQHLILPCINDVCFQLLQNLLVNHALSHSFKEHVVDQVLKLEDGGFTYNDYSLSFLAHTLILQEDSEGSPLTMKIYEGYVCFILEKVKEILHKSPESSDFYTTLPSPFHLEILLMAFHLSKDAEKVSLAKLVFSSLKTLDSPPPGSSIDQLFWWGLYVSRILLILRHFVLYSSSCPSWFLMRFRSHLRKIPSKPFHSQSLGHLSSWASKIVENLFSNSKEIPSVGRLLPQLIDVASPLSLLSKEDSSSQRIDVDWGELASTCSWILNFWSGRMAEAVEHLILERYIFSLCWSIVSANYYGSCPTFQGYDLLKPDLSDIRSFYIFSFTLIGQDPDTCTNIGFPEVINKLLVQLQDDSLVDGWDFLRRATWSSLIFSLLNAGLSRYSMTNMTPGTETYRIKSTDGLFFLGESMILDMLESKRGGWLVSQLSSILKMHLQVFHRAFIQVASSSQSLGDAFSPFILLKHTGFDKSKHEMLLEKSGCSISRLESLYNILPKLDLVAVHDTESTDAIIMRCLLHGFPSISDYCDGNFLSCVLTIKNVISVLEGYFRIKDRANTEEIEVEVKCQLLESMMMIKYDRIFETIHEKCDYICNSLIGQKELREYNDLFHLKQLEVFLAAANDTSDSEPKELLIDMVVDLIQGIQRENSQIFKVYLGFDEAGSQESKEFFDMLHGNFLVLIDSLDKCHSEAVNLKVLKLFVDLFTSPLTSDLKEKIQKKFLQMDLLCLSLWLEKRLLGGITEFATGSGTTQASSSALRELTVDFVVQLVSQPSEILSRELHGRLIEAMLMSLDRAFIFCDIQTIKAYFSFLVQLLNGDPSMKHLLEKSVMLIDTLADNEALLHGLKFLLGFIGTVLSNFGTNKKTAGKLTSKLGSSNSSGPGAVALKSVNSRRNSENLVLPANQESASASLDCDATSVDDDEDDGTSDGEFCIIDKEEDEDSISERALASKVCTFTSSGNNFMEQHWYFCYTCDLTVSKGCCSVCAKVCHRGHRVVYSRSSRFFCDCGAGGVRGSSCQCLKPRKFTGSSNLTSHGSGNFQSFLPIATDGDQAADSDYDFDDDLGVEMDNFFKIAIPKKLEDDLPAILVNLDIEDRLLALCNELLPAVISRRESSHSTDNEIILGKDKMVSYGIDLFQLKKVYKSGTLDLKIKTDYPNSRELKSLLACGSLTKSLLSISARGRLAAGEGDKVAIFDVGQLIGQPTVTPVTTDKTNVKPLSKNIVRFEIVHLVFNPMVDNYLAVAGFEDCQVLTVNPRGEVIDRLAVELALQGAYIRRIAWVPGSQVQFMVVTNMFVKIYDLSQDNISPLHYFTLSDDLIVDATFIPASMSKAFILVLSENGCLFRLEVSIEGDVGAKILTDTFSIQKNEVQSKGLSLCYSTTHRLLFLSYQDGTTLLGRMDAGVTTLTELSYVYENEQDGKLRPAGLHHWKELFPGGLFFCLSSLKSNAALNISLSADDIFAQNMRYGAALSLPLVGIAAYKPLSKDKTHCLVLQEDGSLQIYSHTHTGVGTTPNLNAEQTKKLGSSILNNRAYAGANPEFPLDFFERTMCITGDVKFSSDAAKNGDSESIKQRLASEDGFLEGPSAGFKVTVSNTNSEIVMVGCRIHVGSTSASHIPSEVTIFQRLVKLDEGMRSWYDIPFTAAESLLADEEIIISIGRTFDASSTPRIDSLEIYGRAKDEFCWKEKMEAVLDMEAHFLGRNSGAGGSAKKYRSLHAAPVQEQVLADAIKLLSRIYLSCRPQYSTELESPEMDLNRLKCRTLLETIFQSDGEPLLHSAACHVLQSIFPKREMYYRVKDTMRLLAAVKSFPMLLSKIGIGGAAAGWVIKEFTSQMQAVSKIALNRRKNMATFLELYGSEVLDGLMQVLLGILDLEQLETQTINSIVIPSVELIYSYVECLALHGTEPRSIAPAVTLLEKLLFAPYEAVQTASSLAISSRLLQVPFPKQMMLATDEASENAATPGSSSANATTGIVPGMIEEDSATSSVQYCCDGCSTVPILRRRWHCNICPDFDLCEACYEVLDADRLPPPHSRDHPMSAIPIEIDSLGAEGNEIHFSIDELSGSSLMQVAAEIGMQNSPPSIHVLESNETGDFSAHGMDQTVVSISASQRALNSLLLRHLIGELKGWMDTTSGLQAIPVMQLFYRLSSAVGGPFMDSSTPENLDLERFVQWLLEEINLDRPYPAKTRSSFGEVAIVVFMFFTLMLRNWHHPGGEASQSKPLGSSDLPERTTVKVPSSAPSNPSFNDDLGKNEYAAQLVRACSLLRQQAFLNYLLDILLQLVSTFKSSLVDADNSSSASGCGSLLTVRRELPVGNFSPFFSDSYAKSHRTDLFSDYHKLLLENTFRLVYTLVRPEKQDKSTDKEKAYNNAVGKELKLEGFQDVLCTYISNPHTTFVRRHARRLLLHLCGSKTQYYSMRDSWQFSNEVKRLNKLVNKSGGFQIPVPYERCVKLVKCLSAMSEVAAARPRNWQKFCLKHIDLLQFLMDGIFNFGEESVMQTLRLLNLAFFTGKDTAHFSQKVEGVDAGATSTRSGAQSSDSKKKRRSEDGTENSLDKSFLDMEQAVEIFMKKDGFALRNFIDSFLLEWNSSSVRQEAKFVLYGIWFHGKQPFKEALLTALLEKVKYLPAYGQNILECTELLTRLLGEMPDSIIKQQEAELIDRCLTPNVISSIFETLHSQNELLANHPNSHIYNTLSSLVEFDGYYLESEPCVSCSCPEVPYSRMKLESLKSETKFTDNRIIVKCTGSYTIQSIIMNVHDARKSKSVKVLNLYYNNRPVADLSELKNNWSLWKRAKSCHLAFNQTELKVEFIIPITACNFMIELDSFYENLQASSLESLQCPRCSRSVTDKHGICSNCHENAYQCRQCRNINYENLDSFLCNECGYSKHGRFEFNFMAKPSFSFDNMENDEDMKKGLTAIESESENAHRRYQQLLGFKKPLLKLVSSVGENEIDPQQKDSVQQMMVSLPGPSCKINRKVALLGVVYGEKCKAAFDSVSKSIQTLQGLRRVLMTYLQQKNTDAAEMVSAAVPRSSKNCYGCAITFVTQCLELLQVLSKHATCKKQLVTAGILTELFENNIHQSPKTARIQARAVLCSLSEGDSEAVSVLNNLIQKKVIYCLEHHRSMDIALATREELLLLSDTCTLVDEHWEARLRVAFQLFFSSIKLGAKHPAISEHVILLCLRIISQACTPPISDAVGKEQISGKSSHSHPKNEHGAKQPSTTNNLPSVSKVPIELVEKKWDGTRKGQDIPLLSYSEWERGATYLDFVRRQYKVSQAVKGIAPRIRQDAQKYDYLALKYALRWKRRACKRTTKNGLSKFSLGSWVSELILSTCSQSIRSEVSNLVILLCPQSSFRRFQLLNLLMSLLPASLLVGECAAEYFDLFFQMFDSEAARLYLTVKGFLTTICKLIRQEVSSVESQEKSLNIDISQGFILHKLIELLSKFLEVPNIRIRFMQDELLSEVLEALLVVQGIIVQKTKLINDCNRLLKELLDGLLLESTANKRQFIRACISGLQNHGKARKGRTSLFILQQICNMICPTKPEPVYLLILNKAHTQEEFIRGSMTKNPYSSTEIGPLMRDVKNKICHQLDLLGLLEDDYGMELLVAGNIISLDLSIYQVYEQVWRKYQSQNQNSLPSNAVSAGLTSSRECPPMTVTYRLQGLDGEATEPMINELEEEREESQDPEVEFAIAGAVRDCGGLEIILSMIQRFRDDEFKSNQEELASTLNLLMNCCKIRENRRALLQLGALGLLLETARRAFSVDAMEPAEGILLIVESLTTEANESNIGINQSVLTVTNEESGAGEQAKKIVLMFLERLCHPLGSKKSSKQQRNNEMVARILPYLTYGELAAMEALIQHFYPYLQDWGELDRLQKQHEINYKDEGLAQEAARQRYAIENFVRVSESLKTSSCGERLKDIILEKGITAIAVKHLRDSFAVTGQTGFKSSMEWASGLKLPSLPLILSMLRGLSKGHMPTQRCIDEEGILPLLHALEGVPGENEIGAKAENLLDTLADKESNGDGFLGDKINKIRHATRDEMRRRALRKREELLQGLGMRQEFAIDGGERIVVAQPVIEGLEDVEEEEGLACMVCREGYTLRPNDMLGMYSYSKRVNLGASSSSSGRGDCVYTTVSHFNIIHFQCHQEAKRADAALKNPKKEWEGATLRNNETLCNCIFPLRGPSVPIAQYTRCVDQYWDNLNSLGRSDGSRLRLLTYDIVLMLARFATGASFSVDCKGGGKESNSRFLPFMIQMASFLLDQGSTSHQRRGMAKSVAAYLSNSDSTSSPPPSFGGSRSSSGPCDETVQFMMVNSLLSESYEHWLQHRPAFLQRGIYHAYLQHKHGRSTLRFSNSTAAVVQSDEGSSTDLSESERLFAIIQPMLVYTGLIEQLQLFFKVNRAVNSDTSKESGGDGENTSGLERWEIVMKERMINMKEMVGFSKDMLSWLEEMTSAEDLQEAFDIMGTLPDALSGGASSCEDFVRVAIQTGKS